MNFFHHPPRRRAWETTPHVLIASLSHTHTRAAGGGGGGRKGVTTKTSLLGAAGSPQQLASRLASHHLLPGGDELIRSLPRPPFLSPLSRCHTRTLYYCSRTPSRTHAHTRAPIMLGAPGRRHLSDVSDRRSRSTQVLHVRVNTAPEELFLRVASRTEPNRTSLALFSSTSWLLLLFFFFFS